MYVDIYLFIPFIPFPSYTFWGYNIYDKQYIK